MLNGSILWMVVFRFLSCWKNDFQLIFRNKLNNNFELLNEVYLWIYINNTIWTERTMKWTNHKREKKVKHDGL